MPQFELRKDKRPGRYACAIVLAAGLAWSFHVQAAEVQTKGDAPQAPMNMNHPMPSKMKKEGMKIGDVKRAAEKRDQDMKAAMQKESESMPQGAAKK